MHRNNVLFILFLLVVSHTLLGESKQEVINVGYMDFDSFVNTDDESIEKGYAGDYFYEINQVSEWNYKLINGTWDELTAKLNKNEVDIILLGRKSEERKKKYDFSILPLGVPHGYLFTKDTNDLFYEDFKRINGKKIGYSCESLIWDFNQYKYNKFSNVQMIKYPTHRDCIEALEKDEIDIIASERMQYDNKYRIIGEFPGKPLYAMALKGSKKMEQFCQDQIKLDLEDPYLISDLNDDYYGEYLLSAPLYTRDEVDFIKTKPTISIAVRDLKPLAWLDEKTKEPVGILISILDEIADISQINFNIELVSESMNKNDIIKKYGLLFDANLMSDGKIESNNVSKLNFIIIENMDTKKHDHEKVVFGILNNEFNVPNETLKEQITIDVDRYNDVESLFEALLKDEVHAIIMNELLVSYWSQKPSYSSLFTQGIANVFGELTIFSGEDHRMSKEVLDKTVEFIGRDIIHEQAVSNARVIKYKITVWEHIIKHLIIYLLVFIVMLTLTISYLTYSKNKQKAYNSLKKAKEAADEANEIKTEFLTRMSHDMRTPMNAIIGLSEFGLNETAVDSDQNGYFKQIKNSGEFLLGLLNDVLVLQKLEKRKIELHNEVVYFADFLNNIVLNIENKASHKEIKFLVNFDNLYLNTYFSFDKLRLNQILLNLLNNAVDFTPKDGHILWYLSLDKTTDGNFTLITKISDSGVGISEEMKKKVFKGVFKQSERTDKIYNGLNLMITYNLVSLFNGTIELNSIVNIGTTFIIKIPLKVAEKNEIIQQKKDKEIDNKEDLFKNKRILLCEDIAINAKIAKRILEKVGIIVDVAVDGSIGVEKAKTKHYDLIIMDIRMPVMDGLEATKMIREFNKDIPIIALTANAYDSDVEKSLAVGMQAHLLKPINKIKLFDILRKYL